MITLRAAQLRTVHRTHERLKEGYRLVVVCGPTGFGKRILAAWWCGKAQEQGRHVLFVTNRRLLVRQMFEELAETPIRYGVIMAGTDTVDPSATVQIASIHTLRSRYMTDAAGIKTPEKMPPADLIIVDECHNDVETYQELFSYYPGAKILGLTATPVGSKGKLLTPPYSCVVEEVTNTELIRDGLLLPTECYAPSEPNLKGIKLETVSQTKLGKSVQQCTVFADVFNEWAPFANRTTICFCPGVAYARDLVQQFTNRLGQDQAFLISAETKEDDRKRIFDLVRSEPGRVLVSVDVLKEGFDMPEVSCGIDLQPTSYLRTYWQKVGRIKRACEGQTEAVWLDFAGNYWRFIHPNDDPDWSLKPDETAEQAIERKRKEGDPQPIMCPKCSFVRKAGKACPKCGFECGEPVRHIRMGDGKLKKIPAIAKAKREKSEAERKFGQWKSLLFGGLKTGRSLHSCAVIYRNKTGEWPRDGWPAVFPTNSVQWKRKVGDVITSQGLMIQSSNVVKEFVR
jgi:superfamily II DNA or RNA helicase